MRVGDYGVRRVSLLPVLCPVLVQSLGLAQPRALRYRVLPLTRNRDAASPGREETWGAGGEPAPQVLGSLTSCFIYLCREKEVKCKSEQGCISDSQNEVVPRVGKFCLCPCSHNRIPDRGDWERVS